jgi:hypothetical protein
MIFLLCSFTELTFDYDYSGLATFMPLVDECIFFDSGLSKESISKINERITKVPVKWHNYQFVDFCTMRNDLIKKARKRDPSSWVIMIDDCYSLNCNLAKEEIENCDADLIECDFECRSLHHDAKPFSYKCPKIFRANSFDYVLRVHEILVPTDLRSSELRSTDLRISTLYTQKLKIFDISDPKRSHSRTLRDIAWMKNDLEIYFTDNFIRAHLSLYLADALSLINKEESIKYYQDVMCLAPIGHDYYERAVQGFELLTSSRTS